MYPQLCCCGDPGEAEVHRFLACCEARGFPETSAKHHGWPVKGRVTCRHPSHSPPHANSCPSCQLFLLEEELIVQFPSLNLSSDSKQNKTILATLLHGTVADWKMPTWAKNSSRGLHVIRATHFDFSRCMLHCLLRGNYHFEALCVKNQRMLDTKCPVPTEPTLGTRHDIDIVGVGHLGTEPTPNKCWARCSIWISAV